jgi:glycosyltransferase involved in cell wall biosynthesis
MVTVSLCMIVKNEDEFLEKCLNSVKDLVDEIIIVDTGSTDNTKSIAQKFTDKIFDFEWCDDFSAARNESLKHATKDWILILDADEVIAEHDFEPIRNAIKEEKVDGYVLHQLNYTNKVKKTMHKFVKVNVPSFSYAIISPIVRLFRRSENVYFDFYVHESVDSSLMKLNSKVLNLPVAIHHYEELKNDLTSNKKNDYYFQLLLKNIQKYPSHAKSHYLAALGYESIENNSEKAIEMCEKAIELQPNNSHFQSYLDHLKKKF